MSQSENKINVEEARENLQDALSLLIILENDLATQQSDEIYLRSRLQYFLSSISK